MQTKNNSTVPPAPPQQLDLSVNIVEGLRCLYSTITSDISKKLISNAVKMALFSDSNIPGNPEIYATKPEYSKQAEYAVLSLFLLAIKHSLDTGSLKAQLDGHQLAANAVQELVQVYDDNRAALRIKNLTTGHSEPHITNAEWKLTCAVKSSELDGAEGAAGQLEYGISLGRFAPKTGERESVADFVCNFEELQALLNRLKDIEKHCRKLTTAGGGSGIPQSGDGI